MRCFVHGAERAAAEFFLKFELGYVGLGLPAGLDAWREEEQAVWEVWF